MAQILTLAADNKSVEDLLYSKENPQQCLRRLLANQLPLDAHPIFHLYDQQRLEHSHSPEAWRESIELRYGQ